MTRQNPFVTMTKTTRRLKRDHYCQTTRLPSAHSPGLQQFLDSAVKRRISSFLAALLQKSDTLQSEVLVAMEI